MADSVDDLKKRVAELEEENTRLKTDLIHDSLTHLKTRAFFEEEAKVYIDSLGSKDFVSRRRWIGPTSVSFIFFDIDNFKQLNDTHGHLKGDKVLEAVADAIRGNLREWDTAARWGGEEIVVTLLGATEEDAKNKAEDIRQHIENLELPDLPGTKISVSAGVASAENSFHLDEILKRADAALYKAKEGGRNKVIAYSEL